MCKGFSNMFKLGHFSGNGFPNFVFFTFPHRPLPPCPGLQAAKCPSLASGKCTGSII